MEVLVSCSEVVFVSADEDDNNVLHVDVSSLYCRASREAKREARPMAIRRVVVVAVSVLVAAAEVSSMKVVVVSMQELVVLVLLSTSSTIAPPEPLWSVAVLLIMAFDPVCVVLFSCVMCIM